MLHTLPGGADWRPPATAGGDRLQQTRTRRALFGLVAVALPFLALGGVELVLRLAGVAAPEPLFVAAPEPGWLQPNERVVQRFFANPDAAPQVSIDTAYFRAARPAGGFRAVVLGGSTAAGFPYGKWASLAGILEQRLQREHPGRVVEVIPVAMSAINSWSLLAFTPEVLALEPDAVLIYAGHNEYLGILGVGSAFGGGSPAITRAVLALQQVRLLALGLRAAAALRPAPAAQDGEPATLMARVAAEQRIPLGSPIYAAGLAQFEGNLERMLRAFARRGVPVFIATLASNERDQPPFMPVPPPGLDDAAWQGRFNTARDQLAAGDPVFAQAEAEAMIAAAPDSGEGHFLRGELLLATGDPHAARAAFLAAKDRDALRFRAPEAFNDIVRQAAARHGATVVDVQAALAAAAGGVIGDELMLEHLHPNARGYVLLAETFHAALLAAGLPGGGQPLPAEIAARDAPLSEVERLAGEYRVARLKADWPFHAVRQPLALPPPASEPERIARDWFEGRLDWPGAMNRALAWYQQAGDFEEAARIAINLATAFPYRADARYVSGALLLRTGDAERALPFIGAAVRAEPRNTRYLMSLAQGWYLSGRPAESIQVLEHVLELEPGHPTAAGFIEQLRRELAGP
jgi:tetratricopeptide (TPR) repeat protein